MFKNLDKNKNTNQNDNYYQRQVKEKNKNPINTFDFIMKCPACTETCSSFYHKSDYIFEYNCKNNHKNICTLLQLNENKKTKADIKNIKYDAYCLDCNEDMCSYCENKHKDHKKEFFFQISKILKKQLNELTKKKKEFDALIKELQKEIELKLNIIQKSFEIYLDIKNNFEFLTKEKLDNQINFNMNFIKDFENIINISKENNIIKTFEAIFQLSDKISYKNSIYNKPNNFQEIKVENIYIIKNIKNKEYIIQLQKQLEIKADKRKETNEYNESNNQIINIRKEKQINFYHKFFQQSISSIIDSQLDKKFFKNSSTIYTIFYYNIPYINVKFEKNNLLNSNQNITIHNSKKLKNISSKLSEYNENIEHKSGNSEISECIFDTPEEIDYMFFLFYQDKSKKEDILYGNDEYNNDNICRDNCNELVIKKRVEKEEKFDTYNYNQDIIIIYLKEETYSVDKCKTYLLCIIYCNKYLIFKLKIVNIGFFSYFKAILFLFLVIKFILWFDTWNNYYDLISMENNLIEDIISLLSSKIRNLIEYHGLFNSLIQLLSIYETKYDKKEKINRTKRNIQQITFDKRRDFLFSYENLESPISSFITYQTNKKLSINECYIILYNNILNNLNNLYIQKTIIKNYLYKIIEEIINLFPKKIISEQNLSNNHISEEAKAENAFCCLLYENNNEIENNIGFHNIFEERERDIKLYDDYDEDYSSLDSSMNNSGEFSIEEENENELRDLNIKGEIPIINKLSNSNSCTDSIIMEDIYNFKNEPSNNIIDIVEITNNFEKIKNHNHNLIKQKQKLSYNKILFVLLSNIFNLYPISNNINLISDSFNQTKKNQNKEDISSKKNENSNEYNKNLTMNSNFINTNNNNLAKIKNKSPEFINTIIRLYITNHNSSFFNFNYNGIKYNLHFITAHHRDKIVYILFLFDNVLLFYFKRDKNIRKLIFPYGYLCKNILYGYKHKIGKKFLPK